MKKYNNFKLVLQDYLVRCPEMINIYSFSHKGNCLIPKDTISCRYEFSDEGIFRSGTLLKKDFPNTLALSDYIKWDFLNNKELTSIGYDRIENDTNYNGIKLMNSLGERLNLYFSDDLLELYNLEVNKFQLCKKTDFLKYGGRVINKHCVDKMIIRPSVDDKSSILYIFDNEEYSSSLLKRKQLGCYYREVDGKIENEDLIIISDLIRLFINCHLDENPDYIYKINAKYQTNSLQIVFDSGKIIELANNNVIDSLEKMALIDDLWNLKHGKIDKMPETKIKQLKEIK